MKVLIVGSGGREHALAWKLSQSPLADAIFVAPGNGGTAHGIKNVSNVNIDVSDFPSLVKFAQENEVGLVIPGPEVPLVEGIEGHFRKVGIPVFGPSKEAAQMEGSKAFSKDFMKRHNIPTAEYRNFTDYEQAKAYVESISHNIVIKADGLAAGKGVIIPTTKEEAIEALQQIMVTKEFGEAGNEVVIEEFLEGDELSILTFSDGYNIKSLPPAQDHKRIFDGDQGPNTGGMGCYAPTRIAPKSILKIVDETILKPTIDGLRREGMPFRGILFTGLMMTKAGPKVLEYNVRFGDPETQTVLPLISESTDLVQVMLAAANGHLDSVDIQISDKFSATVVVAAGGYPGSYEKKKEIILSPVAEDTVIFHAGTALVDGKLVSAGGRVIAASATADTLEEAVKKAYKGVEAIKFQDMFFRKDIAHRAFKQKAAQEEPLTYASAGVSVDAGNAFVQRIKDAVRSTKRPGADAEIGGFGGIFDLKAAGYADPLLIAGIDGVGTKLKIACAMGKHSTVGIDLVAMSVNDLLAQGAESLLFLDYYATSKLDIKEAAEFVEGVAEGCRQAGCALIGGETAEMPDMYQPGDYDAAGAAIGAVERSQLLPRHDAMKTGDVLIGVASNGVHSNGYSLIRKIVERQGLQYTDSAPWNTSSTVGDELLVPTRIYVKPVINLVKKNLVKGLSHITGGGLTDNIPRMLPESLAAEVDVSAWEMPALFKWFKSAGGLSAKEYARTWNTGLGLVLVVAAEDQEAVLASLKADGERAFVVGKLVQRTAEDCVLNKLEVWGL
ncbi:phosphoribosylglycinamide synthetase [Tricharina praecox]|uniref:phosphoribosylglycinamide synthetase n=1 Tax=Tricharina praecox TaxID=43433 RepID=UPI00221F79F7|nr:phosphoribosylglycinamide synthetase [Tricharina praecox]KAI5854814.1 phosphoribosylglycinamide synthetase [Tricharina praecox]